MIQDNIIDNVTITKVRDYISILQDTPFSGEEVYRGQVNSEWKLKPSLFRLKNSNPLGNFWQGLEYEMLNEFSKSLIPFEEQKKYSILQLISLAQHHGLPTRLLDWSENPLVALFFACEDENENHDGVVCVLDHIPMLTKYPKNYIDLLNRFSSQTRYLLLYKPAKITKRIIAQNGVFTIHPVPKTNLELPAVEDLDLDKNQSFLYKFNIQSKYKKRIKVELDKLGINSSSLFPDLDGLSRYIKWKQLKKSFGWNYTFDPARINL